MLRTCPNMILAVEYKTCNTQPIHVYYVVRTQADECIGMRFTHIKSHIVLIYNIAFPLVDLSVPPKYPDHVVGSAVLSVAQEIFTLVKLWNL